MKREAHGKQPFRCQNDNDDVFLEKTTQSITNPDAEMFHKARITKPPKGNHQSCLAGLLQQKRPALDARSLLSDLISRVGPAGPTRLIPSFAYLCINIDWTATRKSGPFFVAKWTISRGRTDHSYEISSLSELPFEIIESALMKYKDEFLALLNKSVIVNKESDKIHNPVLFCILRNCLCRIPEYAYIKNRQPYIND